jgi:hypothetical protein
MTTEDTDATEGDFPTVEPMPDTADAFLARMRRVVTERSAVTLRWSGTVSTDGKPIDSIVDMYTASMLVTVADALSPANREKFLGMEMFPMVMIGWRLIEAAKGVQAARNDV